MKCFKCGEDHKRSIQEVLKTVKKYQGIYGNLGNEARQSIAEDLHLTRQMVNRYIKVYNKYQDEIEQEQFAFITGKGINELYKEQKPKKMPYADEFEALKKDFNGLQYKEFIQFLYNNKGD